MSVNDHGGREPPTNYIKQMNAFGEKSIGVLNAREQAMYLRLFLIANQLKWPEWFEVANSQIMREAGIKSKVTTISTRRSLERKGFIQSIDPGHKKKMRYHLPKLYGDDAKGTKNEPIEGARVQNLYPKGTKNEPIEGSKGTKFVPYINSINSKHISSTTTAPPQDENFRQVVEVYENNIRPICSGYELERLQDDIQHYGEDTVIKAIQRAVTRNKRSIGYVEGILRRWETDGFDKEGEHGRSSSGYAGSHRRKAPRKDCTDWDDPNADFGGW